MVQSNPDIERIIEMATSIAQSKNHEYVTLEHLLQGMLTHEQFREFLDKFGADTENMQKDLDAYLDKQTHLVSQVYDVIPKKTHSLERVFNRAFTQVLFSGRQSLQTIDLFLSVMTEDKSYAKFIITKYGLDRNKLVNLWNKTYQEKHGGKRSKSHADQI